MAAFEYTQRRRWHASGEHRQGGAQAQRSTKSGCWEAAGKTGQRKRETWPTCKLELRKQWRLDQLQSPGTEIGQATGFPDQSCSVCLAQSLTNEEPNGHRRRQCSAPCWAGRQNSVRP